MERESKIVYDFSKLRGRIKEIFGTEYAFADAMGYNRSTISAKLNQQSEWTRADMDKACTLLNIQFSEVGLYFFWRKSC